MSTTPNPMWGQPTRLSVYPTHCADAQQPKETMKYESYIGDGVYAHLDEAGRVVMTTGHHDPKEAGNTIVLEPEVLAAFETWALRMKAAET